MQTLLVVLLAAVPATGNDVAQDAAVAPSSRGEAYYHYSLGLQARFRGDSDAALSEYREAQKLDPTSAPIRVETARLFREMGRLDEAMAEAKEATSLDPDNADAHLALAQLYQIQAVGAGAEAAIRSAASEYEDVVRLRPSDGQSLLNLANIYGSQLNDHVGAARAWGMYLELDPGNFEAYVQRGTHLLLSGREEEAASALRAALELEPDSARAYQMLGEILARSDRSEEAIASYRKALELEPDNIRVRLALGEALQRSGDQEGALQQAEVVLAADDSNRYALELKGRALRDLRRYDEAQLAADKLREYDPDDLKAAYLQVTIAEARRDYQRAVALLEEILAGPEDADAAGTDNARVFLVHLGFAYQQLGRFDDAADAFARAQEAAGESVDANLMIFRAEALSQARETDDALAVVREGRERFPDDPDLAGLEANLVRDKGDETAATALIEDLRRKGPDDVKVLGRVADFYRRARQYPEAQAALEHALEIDPKNLATLFQLGAVLERQARHDQAEGVFRDALEIDPDSAPVLNYLGYMNADRNVRLEEALDLTRRAVEQDPGSAAYLDSMGWALFRLNRLEAAEEAVRKALDKDTENAVILDHLGDILHKRGRVAEALVYWQKALKGDDEEGELDRPKVETKVRDAQGVLRAQQSEPRPPNP